MRMTWYEPEADWTYADRKLITARCIVLWAVMVFIMADFVVFSFVFASPWIIGTFVALALALWFTWLIYRSVTAHAWAEREDDLIVKRGRMFRSVTVVPYGRMQFVEVSAGPHVVRITRAGFRPHEETIRVKAGAEVRLIDLILTPATP